MSQQKKNTHAKCTWKGTTTRISEIKLRKSQRSMLHPTVKCSMEYVLLEILNITVSQCAERINNVQELLTWCNSKSKFRG